MTAQLVYTLFAKWNLEVDSAVTFIAFDVDTPARAIHKGQFSSIFSNSIQTQSFKNWLKKPFSENGNIINKTGIRPKISSHIAKK